MGAVLHPPFNCHPYHLYIITPTMSSEGEQASAVVESVGTTGSLNHEQQEVEVSHKEEALHQNAEGLEVEQDADDPPVLRTEVKGAEQASNPAHSVPDVA